MQASAAPLLTGLIFAAMFAIASVFVLAPSTGVMRRVLGTKNTRKGGAFYGYSLTILALGAGWLLRDRELVNAANGLGYWLGVTGSSMMLLLLLYPLRKRIRALRFLGSTAVWFRTHMILGVLGPLLVLYHTNFQLGSLNSRVALVSMLLVACSGVVGRHLYARIHRGLYGGKTSLKELCADLGNSVQQSEGFVPLIPETASRLNALAEEVQGDKITGLSSPAASLSWTFRRYWVWWALHQSATRELNNRRATDHENAEDTPQLRRSISEFIRRFVKLSGQVAQFSLYERLFALWHILHLPLFFMMVISALVHILAVHMY